MKILIAEDDPISRSVLADMTADWGYQPQVVSDGLAAHEALLAPDAPQLALLDWVMPHLSGPEVCRRLRRHPLGRCRYFILLTVRDGPADVVAGLTAGANDYVVKPYDPRELRVRLLVARRTLTLQQELLAAESMLRQQASRDALTGLLNRQTLCDELVRLLARSRRQRWPVAAMLADIDRFKQVNDTLGHGAGDAVLAKVAQLLAGSLRGYDLLGRYGGDEFLLVAAPCDSRRACELAERIRLAVAKTPIAVSEAEIGLTISVGLAVAPHGIGDAERLIEAADQAMYRAKRAGGDGVDLIELTPPSGASYVA